VSGFDAADRLSLFSVSELNDAVFFGDCVEASWGDETIERGLEGSGFSFVDGELGGGDRDVDDVEFFSHF
jgi:hypothetical protein